ncbi:MAG TPA: AraC family transcriptional regulator [Bacteroidales bacterium]|nr:AraC family transcriptional regulator [Bacteroidales bacterium]
MSKTTTRSFYTLPRWFCFLVISFLLLHAPVFAGHQDSAYLFSRLAKAEKHEQLEILHEIYSKLYAMDPAKTEIYSRKALTLAKELNDRRAQAKACYAIAYCYRFKGMTDSALLFNRQGFDISRELNDKALIARGYNSLGGIYLYGGQKVKALENLMKVISLHSVDDDLMANACFSLGLLYGDAGRSDKSVYYYLKSLNIRERQKQWTEAAYIYCNLAGFYFQSFNFKEGINTYNKALALFRKENYLRGMAYAYNNIGMAYQTGNMPDSALRYFKMALGINLRDVSGTRSALVFNLDNIGNVWMKTGRLDSAGYYLEQALKWAQKGGDNIALSCVYLSLGELRYRQGRYAAAIDHLKTGLDHAQRVNLSAQEEQACSLLAKCYEASGKLDQALHFMKKGDMIRDSIYNEKAREEVANMMIRYETRKKEQEILNLQIDAKVRQRNIREAGFMIAALLIIISLATWRTLRFYRRKLLPKVKAMHFIEQKINHEKEKDNRTLKALERVLPPDLKPVPGAALPELKGEDVLIEKMERLINERKAYLNEDFSLAEAARMMGTNTSYLSRLINEHYRMNFSTFVNRFRVEEAKRMIYDNKHNHLSMEGIAKSTGFRSKSTFNQVFKNMTGQTPTEFARNRSGERA